MGKLIDFDSYPVQKTLKLLLQDKTTKKNIIWATDAYHEKGFGFRDKDHIDIMALKGLESIDLQSRTEKAMEKQQERTRKKAEVFTPVWLCNKMNNYVDKQWFGRKDVFNIENEPEHTWTVNLEKVPFNEKNIWKKYVDSRRLEITCGEAPYLVSRYDVTTGELILPPLRRIGILDRKLRVVGENALNNDEWIQWALRAFQSCYGFEYQGDNLLIARINLIMTFSDYFREQMELDPSEKILKQFANVIAWNTWQMDGLKDTVPLGKPHEQYHQMSLFDIFENQKQEDVALPCKIKNWRANETIMYSDLKGGCKNMEKKLFNFCIGNPPYQEVTESDSTRMPPVYDKFMDATNEVADVVELITPARFLFNAGQTPKAWNQKMLDDPHLKVLFYEQDASKIFPNTDIKGGVAVTYRNSNEQYGPIRVFVPYEELRGILEKAGAKYVEDSLTDIADSSNVYNLSNIYADHPDYTRYIGDGGRHSQLKTNVLNINPIFTDKPTDSDDYSVYGLINGKRGKKYCHRQYLKSEHKSLCKYKVLVPKATGSGKFGDVFAEMLVVKPGDAFTQTYISIGMFDEEGEARNLLKYLKTKFCRALLFVLKVTQDNLPAVWRYIPKQDFTDNSDIDWSKSVHEIDQQLYKKYDLCKNEIEFIEKNVKEMV